jgi:hypothetical protein
LLVLLFFLKTIHVLIEFISFLYSSMKFIAFALPYYIFSVIIPHKLYMCPIMCIIHLFHKTWLTVVCIHPSIVSHLWKKVLSFIIKNNVRLFFSYSKGSVSVWISLILFPVYYYRLLFEMDVKFCPMIFCFYCDNHMIFFLTCEYGELH